MPPFNPNARAADATPRAQAAPFAPDAALPLSPFPVVAWCSGAYTLARPVPVRYRHGRVCVQRVDI